MDNFLQKMAKGQAGQSTLILVLAVVGIIAIVLYLLAH